MMSLSDLTFWDYVVNLLDILLVWFIIYKLFNIIRGTKAIQLLKGIFVIVVVRSLSGLLGLNTLQWLMDQVVTWGVLAIIIIFQPEMRRALEQLGRGKLFSRNNSPEDNVQERLIEEIVKASAYMAKRRIGALISVEKETGLGDYIETGIPLEAHISSELLINIFIPNTPLHDGAVILQDNRIQAAACYLPLSESPFISKELGTRHRAGIGISEVTDCITIVISEETGSISITKSGELYRDLDEATFKEMLLNELVLDKGKMASPNILSWRGKTHG